MFRIHLGQEIVAEDADTYEVRYTPELSFLIRANTTYAASEVGVAYLAIQRIRNHILLGLVDGVTHDSYARYAKASDSFCDDMMAMSDFVDCCEKAYASFSMGPRDIARSIFYGFSKMGFPLGELEVIYHSRTGKHFEVVVE